MVGEPMLQLGQVVESIAGRDRGMLFVVIGILDERFILVADGDMRRVDRPKKKNLKHLRPTGVTVEKIATKLRAGERVSNAELRKVLETLNDKSHQEI